MLRRKEREKRTDRRTARAEKKSARKTRRTARRVGRAERFKKATSSIGKWVKETTQGLLDKGKQEVQGAGGFEGLGKQYAPELGAKFDKYLGTDPIEMPWHKKPFVIVGGVVVGGLFLLKMFFGGKKRL